MEKAPQHWPRPQHYGNRPKSKMPPMHLGGLTPPPLGHLPRAPLQIGEATPCQPPPPRPLPKSLCPTPPPQHEPETFEDQIRPVIVAPYSLVQPTSLPPDICRHSRGNFQTALQHWTQAKQQYESWLAELIRSLGPISQIFVNFVNSTSYNFVIKQLLAQTGPSTLDLYSRAIDTTQIWMTHIGVTWNDISLHYLVIILDNAREASKSDAQSIRLQPPQLLRGLRWLAKTALMDNLAGILNNFLMASFLKGPGQPKDRKEAMPIPMLVLLRWEETVLNPSSPQWLTLLLGGFLLATWASLRYADLQRTDLSNLSLATNVLRGICRLTKTTRTGQPFGISLFGMTAISPQTCWVTFWLRAVQMALYRTKPFQPDFAIPVLNNYSAPIFIAPLSYASALKALRWAAQTPWMQRTLTPEMAQSLTLHSLKVTFLASAAQLRLPTRARKLQGHHTAGSMQLYSRDDTVDAIWLQEQISQQLRQGWRPCRPLQRGGQHPLPEPSFSLPFSTLPPSIDIPVEPGLSLFQLGLVSDENLETSLDPDDSSTSTSLSTCSSDSEEELETLPSENLPTVFIQNGPAGCCHVATVAIVDLPTRRFLEHQDQSWSPMCGAALRPSAKVISLDQVQWPCNRASCRRAFDRQASKDA